MLRRLAPAFVALAVGVAALGWGLFTLQRMFADEAEEAKQQLRQHREQIEFEASQAVRKQFKLRQREALERSHLARADPLESSRTLFWVRNDVLLFPAAHRPPMVSEVAPSFSDDPLEAQRQFLREANRFARRDFQISSANIVERSKRAGVPVEPFERALQELELGVPILPYRVASPTLLSQTWYLEALPNGEVRGCEAPLETVLSEVAAGLRDEGTIGEADRLHATVEPFQPLATLAVELEMPALQSAEREIDRRYGLKNSMVIICGLLAIAVALFGVAGQRRKQRFLDLKSDFVATVSHELRTPLASIRLLAETLERSNGSGSGSGSGPDEAIKQFPARIVRVADGLHFLVENILSFNQVAKGRWVTAPRALRLEELVDGLRNDLADASTKPVLLSLNAPADLELFADPALMRLLFANLGRNACAYHALPTVEISIAAARDARSNVTLRFTDNGIGIPGDEWENVFHDFYRLKATGAEVHGSGLGLALCRKILALHRGTIEIEKSWARGTTFVLRFRGAP